MILGGGPGKIWLEDGRVIGVVLEPFEVKFSERLPAPGPEGGEGEDG